MKLCIAIAAVFCFIAGATAYEQYIGNARHPDHPGKCYHKDTDYAIAVGEVYRPVGSESCAKYTCRDDFVILVNYCPRYQVPGGCKPISGDRTQPFPECCAKLSCVDNKDGKEEITSTYSE